MTTYGLASASETEASRIVMRNEPSAGGPAPLDPFADAANSAGTA